MRSALTIPADGSTVNLVNAGTAAVDLSGAAELRVTPQTLAHAVQLQLADELGFPGLGHCSAAHDDPWG